MAQINEIYYEPFWTKLSQTWYGSNKWNFLSSKWANIREGSVSFSESFMVLKISLDIILISPVSNGDNSTLYSKDCCEYGENTGAGYGQGQSVISLLPHHQAPYWGQAWDDSYTVWHEQEVTAARGSLLPEPQIGYKSWWQVYSFLFSPLWGWSTGNQGLSNLRPGSAVSVAHWLRPHLDWRAKSENLLFSHQPLNKCV